MDSPKAGKPENENPKQFLLRLQNKKIRVFLKWGQYYEGIFVSSDNYFNILLSDCYEYENNDFTKIGDTLIRCNNIKIIQEIL